MPHPLISIIIPVYNVEKYLRECLDSIVNQNASNYEVILIDDGSTDGSPKICDDYTDRYAKVSVIHRKNGGVSSARNAGLDVAKGEWIWFVDADDYVADSSLPILNTTTQCDCDTIFHGLNRVFDNRKIITGYHDEEIKLCKEDFLSSHSCYQNGMLLFSSKIIRDYHIRYSKDIKMGEDLEFQYKYLLHCKHPIAIPYNFYYIRERQGSASRSSVSVRNNMLGCQTILTNMISFITPLSDRGHKWMGIRLAERLKVYMQSASLLTDMDFHEVQKNVRFFVREYKALGYNEFAGLSFILSCIDIRLYYISYKLLLKKSNCR